MDKLQKININVNQKKVPTGMVLYFVLIIWETLKFYNFEL